LCVTSMTAPSVENVTILARKNNLQQSLVTNNLLLVVVGDPLHGTSVFVLYQSHFPPIGSTQGHLFAYDICVCNCVLAMNIAELMLIDINPKNISIEQCIVRRRTQNIQGHSCV